MTLRALALLSALTLLATVATSHQRDDRPEMKRATRTKVVLLGTGTPVPDPDRSGPATAIVVADTACLVDFGPGVVRRAQAAVLQRGITALEPGNLKVAFVTHLHIRPVEMSQVPRSRDDEAAIRRVIADQTAAFDRHELDWALYTEDADFVNAQGIWLKGAADIERARNAEFQSALKSAAIKMLDVRVRFGAPDVAIGPMSP